MLEAGASVHFVARGRTLSELRTQGLALQDLGGARATHFAPASLSLSDDPGSLHACDVVLVCVKSAQSADAAQALAAVVPSTTLLVSLQNGVRNAEILRSALGPRSVLDGIVGFNVVAAAGSLYRQATSGLLVIEASTDPRAVELLEHLRRAGFHTESAGNIREQQWSKLVMNLNNAIGALTDAPTPRLLFDAGYRRIVAAVMREALAVLRHAEIRPARLGPLPPQCFPMLLRLPTPLLRLAARAQLRMDPEARSSMWQDLDRRRPTEVDHLNGELVRLATEHGTSAPLNTRIVTLIHEAEARGAGSPKLDAPTLRAALGLA